MMPLISPRWPGGPSQQLNRCRGLTRRDEGNRMGEFQSQTARERQALQTMTRTYKTLPSAGLDGAARHGRKKLLGNEIIFVGSKGYLR